MTAGDIAQLWGLNEARIGDRLGQQADSPSEAYFSAPTLETRVRPVRPEERTRLHAALREMAEQDPFINVRRGYAGGLFVSLYGEVQKEVIGHRLHTESDVEVTFEPTRPIHVEKPSGVGEAEDMSRTGSAVGFRIEPGGPGGRVGYRIEVERGSLLRAFHIAIEESVHRALLQGLYGWEVIDCTVTLIRSGYNSVSSRAGDFRALTPLVLMRALRRAGTRVHEPVNRFELEIPVDALSDVLWALAELGATPQEAVVEEEVARIEGEIPAGAVHAFQRRLPALTGGAGVFLSRFAGHRQLVRAVPAGGNRAATR